MLTGISNMPFT